MTQLTFWISKLGWGCRKSVSNFRMQWLGNLCCWLIFYGWLIIVNLPNLTFHLKQSHLFAFFVFCAGYPYIRLSRVGDHCTDPGKETSYVTWSFVPVANSDDVVITCTGDGTDIGPTGGIFGVGFHVVTCTATNSGGCARSRAFGFSVIGER